MLLLQLECNRGITVIQQICRVVAGLFLPASQAFALNIFHGIWWSITAVSYPGKKMRSFLFSKNFQALVFESLGITLFIYFFFVKADQGIVLWGMYQFKFALAEGEICRNLAYQPGNHFVWEEWFMHWCSQQTEAVVDAVCGPWAPGIGWYGPGPLDQMFYRICKDMKAFLKDWEVAWEDQGGKRGNWRVAISSSP